MRQFLNFLQLFAIDKNFARKWFDFEHFVCFVCNDSMFREYAAKFKMEKSHLHNIKAYLKPFMTISDAALALPLPTIKVPTLMKWTKMLDKDESSFKFHRWGIVLRCSSILTKSTWIRKLIYLPHRKWFHFTLDFFDSSWSRCCHVSSSWAISSLFFSSCWRRSSNSAG